MCDKKYLSKWQHLAKYLGKSFAMQINPKSFSSVEEWCFVVLNIFISVIILSL